MILFRCLVVSPEGRTGWRQVAAASETKAVAQLAADGLTAIEVRTGGADLWERLNRNLSLRPAASLEEQSLILTQLAMLVRAGLPVDRSLDLLRDQAPRAAQREMVRQMLARVRSGGGLARAIEESGAFPAYVVGVIRSAEKAGRLGEALTSVAERMSLAAATRRQLATALTYPAAVLAATILALVLILLLVVPQFEPLFAGSEERLPALTRMVLGLSRMATESGLFLLVMLVAAGAAGWALIRSAPGRRLARRHRGRIPGMTLRDHYLAGQLCGLLGTLIQNGVPVLAALQLAREAIASGHWRAGLRRAEQGVREGASLSRALAQEELVPRTAIRLVEVGERTGSLADTCIQASAVIGAVARSRIDRIVALANPIAIIALGSLVALLVAGVMLGIFALGDFAG